MFIKQTKAKDYTGQKLDGNWFYSIKKDGVYTQIHANDGLAVVFSSRGTEICTMDTTLKNGIYEAELAHNMKRDRRGADNALKFLKKNNYLLDGYTFYIFDIIDNRYFKDRIQDILNIGDTDYHILRCDPVECMHSFPNEEGIVIKHESHTHTKTRTNLAYKVKPVNTADLQIISKDNGYFSLVDAKGITAKVKVSRQIFDLGVVGNIVEIKYDRIVNKYDQASFIDFRDDKEYLC